MDTEQQFPRVIAVDWSGDKRNPRRKIWLAEAKGGRLERMIGGLNREEAVEHVIAAATRESVVTGFDFAFSLPGWYVRELGCRSIGDLWMTVAREGEEWMARCEPPFWGRSKTTQPCARKTEGTFDAPISSRRSAPSLYFRSEGRAPWARAPYAVCRS